jgi:threonine 3-dehydrogenase
VVAVGDGGAVDQRGEALAPGDRVVWGVTVACHDCERCRSGRTAKCHHVRKVGHEPVDGGWPLSGSYATHVLLPRGATIVQVPDTVGDAAAATSACAMATVVACLDAAGPLENQRVLVSGLGMLGVSACLALAAAGAAEIVGVDPDLQGQVLARRFGADAAVAPPTDGAAPAGGSFDVAIELSGAPQAVAAAIGAAGVGARVVLAGSVAPDGTVPLDPEQVVRRHLMIIGVHNYEPRHLARAVELLASSASDLGEVVASPVSLDDLPAVLAGAPPPASSIRRTAVDPRLR